MKNGRDESPFRTIDEAEALAHDRLDPGLWHYLAGGAGGETTLAANRAAFGRWHLRPQVLVPVAEPDLSCTFLGMRLASPVGIAPFAGDALLDPEGAAGIVRAGASRGALVVVSDATGQALETVAQPRGAAPILLQTSTLGSVERAGSLAQRAVDAGYDGICLTVDTPVVGVRRRDAEHRFELSAHMTFANFTAGTTPLGERSTPWDWNDLSRFAGGLSVPLVVKGITNADDARRAVEAGAAAIYVSNHGGRQLDGAGGTLDALPEVVEAVGGEADVAFDGGVRSGADVIKALALGARLVLVGRLAAYALAAGGAAGVEHMLDLLNQELATSLVLLGQPSVDALDASALQAAFTGS
jgi:4-hydroxymandelate oxidase